MKPDLGIVTLSFNKRRFIQQTIDSIHRNGIAQVQHVIVDPGSVDGTLDVLESNRHVLTHLVIESDGGPADGLNKGFALLDADVFGYLNGDDLFEPGCLQFVQEFFSHNPDADVLFGAIRMIDENGRQRWRLRRPDKFDLQAYAYQVCYVYQQATFFRASAFYLAGGFNTINRTCWDGELVVDLALAGARFAYTDRVLGSFRFHSGSLTASPSYQASYSMDCIRIRNKILGAGVKPLSSFTHSNRQLAYKLNPFRHYSYLNICERFTGSAPKCNVTGS
ncbi:MAG: glycosyltransferase [Acidobacteriia bacterium]|nr:glycosyltransferase [Terriglobia bacterium]